MTKINDGGSAFPQHGWSNNPETLKRMATQQGMTLRAYFAGQALTNPSVMEESGGTRADAELELHIERGTYDARVHWPKLVAKRCVEYADALIAELEKEKT
jgi:hypothetical protein